MSALRGKRIVVTRPAEQAEKLAREIEARGGSALRFPVLAIFDADDPRPLRDAAARIDGFDLAIFVSPNAARKALAVITEKRPWPAKVAAAAMGETSARSIAAFGVARILAPEGGRFDSEALLERPELQAEALRGRRVAIFRGDAGRELLGETLAARGARVERIPCYRRGRPRIDAGPLRTALAQGAVDALTVTSSEGAGQPGGDGRRGGCGGAQARSAVRRPPAHRRGGAGHGLRPGRRDRAGRRRPAAGTGSAFLGAVKRMGSWNRTH